MQFPMRVEELATHPAPPFLFLTGKFLVGAEQCQFRGWDDAGKMKLYSFSSCRIILRCFYFLFFCFLFAFFFLLLFCSTVLLSVFVCRCRLELFFSWLSVTDLHEGIWKLGFTTLPFFLLSKVIQEIKFWNNFIIALKFYVS